MRLLIGLAMILSLQSGLVHANGQIPTAILSPASAAIQECAFTQARQAFTHLKVTIGLRNEAQLEAIYEITKVICTEQIDHPQKETVSVERADNDVLNGVRRAYLYVFKSRDA